jgi:Spy/CpxP family protein refolding chaperone
MQRHRLLTLALAAAGLTVSTSTAAAQTASPTPPSVQADTGRRMMDPVSRLLTRRDELKITDEQATRLEAIRDKYKERNQARIDDLRRNRENRRALRASMDSARTEVMAVLTPDQQAKVAEMRKHHHRGRHGKKHGDDDRHDDDGHRHD